MITTTAQPNSTQNPRVSRQVSNILFLDCTGRISGVVVVIAGLLTSLWANSALILISTEYAYTDYKRKEEMFILQTIIQTCQLTHLIITLAVSAGLILGVKEKNRALVLAWLIVKRLEIFALIIIIGCMIVGLCSPDIFHAIFFFLVFGTYIATCVSITYKNMNKTTTNSSLEEVSLDIAPAYPLPEDPPSYDSFINETRTNIPS